MNDSSRHLFGTFAVWIVFPAGVCEHTLSSVQERKDGKILGRHLELTWEITAYEPPHTIQQRTGLGAAQLVVTMTLEATIGGTKVTVLHEGESGGELDLPDTLIAQYLKKQSSADLAALRRLVEAGATATPVGWPKS